LHPLRPPSQAVERQGADDRCRARHAEGWQDIDFEIPGHRPFVLTILGFDKPLCSQRPAQLRACPWELTRWLVRCCLSPVPTALPSGTGHCPLTAPHLQGGAVIFVGEKVSRSPQPPSVPTQAPHSRRHLGRNLSIQPPRGRRQMKKIVVGATLLALLGSPAVAQTTSTTPPTSTTPTSSPLPPGLADLPETKWGASDLPPGLSNAQSNRGWDTPPGWSNQNSQGWQNSGGTSATAGGSSATAGGPSAMGAGRGRGR
jgi:hypothetical protein